MRNILPFVFFALFAFSYFAYPGTTEMAWYFALGAVLFDLVALQFVIRYGLDTCIVDSRYHRINIYTNLFNIFWICSIEYTDYIGTAYVFALVLPYVVAVAFFIQIHKVLINSSQ